MNRTIIGSDHCQVCRSKNIYTFFELIDMPVNIGIQYSSQDRARECPKGDIQLTYCEECGFIWNRAFDSQLLDYTDSYDNSLFFSARYREHAHSLAKHLIETYGLYGKDIIEIGCGKGDFLRLICQLGDNSGVGFDTSYSEGGESESDTGQVVFVKDFYSEQYANVTADLICCRLVLEHIDTPAQFVADVRKSIGDRMATAVYFEVPSVDFILREHCVWDIIYEHCSQFSPGSFARLFEECGFTIRDVSEVYEGQYLSLEAKPTKNRYNAKRWGGVRPSKQAVIAFAEEFEHKVSSWQDTLNKIASAGKRAVLWGGGAKGVSFLNMLKIDDQVQYAVDINPRKQGLYLPGTSHEIVSPESLTSVQPDIVIIVNPIYKQEIQDTLTALKLKAEILVA